MEEIKEIDEKDLRELLSQKKYKELRETLSEMNTADIAAIMDEMEDEDSLRIFRILNNTSSPPCPIRKHPTSSIT